MLVRKPHVAGTFYPEDPVKLRQFCEEHLPKDSDPVLAKAVILPHAGYIYSGATACRALARVQIPEKIFLIGPNHTGHGSPFSLVIEGAWETPLGRVPIDERLAADLLASVPGLSSDDSAHRFEHSLEVEIPFLQTKNPDIQIIPLVVGTLDLKLARTAALAIGERLGRITEPILIVVSTDMSHYESDEATRKKDHYALEAIQNLDSEALAKAVTGYRISMCGFVPVYMLLVMAEKLGIRTATLVDYTTSAPVSGDYDRVVGYAGFILE